MAHAKKLVITARAPRRAARSKCAMTTAVATAHIRLVAAVLLLLITACAPADLDLAPELGEVTSLPQLAEAFPAAAPLIARARPGAIEQTATGYRVIAAPTAPQQVGRWRTTARTLIATVSDDDPSRFELTVPERGYRVGVRRIGGEGAYAVATESALHVRRGDNDVEGHMFAVELAACTIGSRGRRVPWSLAAMAALVGAWSVRRRLSRRAHTAWRSRAPERQQP